MKVLSSPLALIFLLLLLGAAAWNLALPHWASPWLLPGLGAMALAFRLAFGGLSPRIWAGLAALLGLIALYAWNPTHRWNQDLGLLGVEHVGWLPGSAFPDGSWLALGLALAVAGAYVLAYRLSEHQVVGLQVAATLAAAAMALAVLAQRLEPIPFPVYARTGIFVNENHFAAFANLIWPVVLATACRMHLRTVQQGRVSGPAGVVLLAGALLAAAVVLSRSRAGVAVLALELMAAVAWCRVLLRAHPFAGLPNSAFAKGLGCLAIGFAAWLALAAFAREWQQVAAIRGEWSFRAGILKDALTAWWAQPVWGTGPGTFAAVFPYYQSPAFQGHAVMHAHCEPIQFLSEFGIAGGLWVALGVGGLLSANGGNRTHFNRIPVFAELERRAFALGLAACALHALIDFPLRIPLIALVAAAWAGVWAGNRPAAEPEERPA